MCNVGADAWEREQVAASWLMLMRSQSAYGRGYITPHSAELTMAAAAAIFRHPLMEQSR